MGKKIEIRIDSLENAGKRFINAWHEAEKYEEIKKSKNILTFKNLELLLRILTPKRLELLTVLHQEGPMSIRALSKMLNRDYSNVHTDVKQLVFYGLIDKINDEQIIVPWEEIIAHFSVISNSTPPKNKPHKNEYHKKAS
jgi:predicted transcriptional regulator